MSQKEYLDVLIQFKNTLLQENRFKVIEHLKAKPIHAKDQAPKSSASMDKNEKDQRLLEIKNLVESCTLCSLHQTRIKAVFGDGNYSADIMFIGEAPGADEDAQGLPFVGRAGQLLTKFIQAVMLDRSSVFICNILKCRPPGNADPNPDQIRLCTPYLKEQIQLIDPKIIITLGRYASQYILDTNTPITKLRGVPHEKDGRTIFPTYHPSALLRKPSLKLESWKDIRRLRILMDQFQI